MVIFYNKKLKNSCHLLGNRAEPLKYATMSDVFYYTMREGRFLRPERVYPINPQICYIDRLEFDHVN
jgi:hypothetical protein